MRRIPFAKNHNLRELGGIPISLSSEISFHQFLRADALLELTDCEIEFLRNYGIKVIIDLRNDEELIKNPNTLANNVHFQYYSIPFLNETKLEEKNNHKPSRDLSGKTLLEIYIDILENHKSQIKLFFDTILGHINVGVLYHCSAGKDRTGILTALLLSIAGVDRLDILADYEVSYTFLLPKLRKLQASFPNLPMHIMASDAENLDKALEYIIEKYSSIIDYIHAIGVSQDDILKLRKKLVQ